MSYQVVLTDGINIANVLVETDGWDGYQGWWRQRKPFSKMIPSAGTFRWIEAEKWPRDGSKWRGQFYYSDGSTPAFALYTGSVPGFQAYQRGTGRQFGGSILVDTSRNKMVEELWVTERTLAWASRTVEPDWDGLWIGPAFKLGGMATVVGYEVAGGMLFNAGKAGCTGFGAASKRFGFGAGASGGFAVCLVTGCRTAQSLVGTSFGGFDLGLAIGEKWASWLKGVKYASQIGKFLTASREVAVGAKGVNSFVKNVGREDWVNLSKLLVNCVNSSDFNNPSVSFFDIPPAGGGLELSFYNSTGEIKVVRDEVPDPSQIGPPPNVEVSRNRTQAVYATRYK